MSAAPRKFPRHSYTAGGNLYVESRKPHIGTVVRPQHYGHCTRIENTRDLRATLRAGKYTSLGSYPVYFYTSDGAALCWECAREEYKQISRSVREKSSDGWRVVGCEINYESHDLTCDNCSKAIESAYGDSKDE
jgi:hypothetical protein